MLFRIYDFMGKIWYWLDVIALCEAFDLLKTRRSLYKSMFSQTPN